MTYEEPTLFYKDKRETLTKNIATCNTAMNNISHVVILRMQPQPLMSTWVLTPAFLQSRPQSVPLSVLTGQVLRQVFFWHSSKPDETVCSGIQASQWSKSSSSRLKTACNCLNQVFG